MGEVEHCAHCTDHETRMRRLEANDIITNAAVSFVRWLLTGAVIALLIFILERVVTT